MVRNRNEDTADSAAKNESGNNTGNREQQPRSRSGSRGRYRSRQQNTTRNEERSKDAKGTSASNAQPLTAHLHQSMAIPSVHRKTPGSTSDTTVTTQGKEDIAVIKARVRTGTIRSIPPSPTGDMAIHAKAGKMRP